MAKKRFTDIEIWDKEWYMELSPTHKCLMKYIFDKCDAAGCWKPNWKLASLHINDRVTQSDLSSLPAEQYEILENGKIYIPDFIKFQYGTLSEKSPAHNPVFSAIIKNNLSDRVFNRVQSTPKEKDIEKEVDKDTENYAESPKSNGSNNEKYLCPKMLSIFKKHIPSYREDAQRDYEPLGNIGHFIFNQGKINGNIFNHVDEVCQVWELSCKWIAADAFYSQKSLKTISNHYQEIINKTQNGTNRKSVAVSNARTAGADELLGNIKQELHSRR